MRRIALGAAGLLAFTGSGLAQERDAARAAWRYHRDVSVAAEGELATLVVPLDVARRSQTDLRDLRLVASDETEVPYVVERAIARDPAAVASWSGSLEDQRREKQASSAWVIDLGEARTFDRLDLDVQQSDFAKRALIELSEDGQRWRPLVRDTGLFEREWGGRLRHTHVLLPQAVTARWLRVTADDSRSRPIDVVGARVSATRSAGAQLWHEPCAATLVTTQNGATRYRLDVPAGTPLDELRLDADDPAFARMVTLYDVRMVNGRRDERALAHKRVYRLRLADAALAAEDVAVPVSGTPLGALELVVEDGDSPPLRRLRGTAGGAATRLLFPVAAPPLALYYGNAVTRAPLYDLDSLRAHLAFAGGLAAATLGPEVVNPRFAAAPPLPLAGALGAAVEGRRWRFTRPVEASDREDVFSLVLDADDLAASRPDLGDVRLVDASDHQVPYILAHDAAVARIDLTLEPMPGGRDPRRRELRIVVPEGKAAARDGLPLHALELDIAQSFFSRPARLLAAARQGQRDRDEVASVVLARREQARPEAPCWIALDGRRHRELVLEIDEGDNAPLDIRAVRAVVKVPRLAFKARPGAYRLLLGNDDVAAPRYDLAALRQEVLAYSAVPAPAGPLEANARYRRSGRDYLTGAPKTLVLWGTLLASVVGLLLLTLRVLRAPAAE
jgi:hypothetical protein